MSTTVNYAQSYGIHSLAAAIVFTIIYAPFVVFYLYRSMRNPTFVHFMLTLFCILRVTAFATRAALAGDSAAASNLNLLIANQVIYSVGFFGLIYALYSLILDRQILAGVEVNNPVGLFTSNRHLIRLALTVGVITGIIGAVYISSSTVSKHPLGKTLRIVGIAIYLAVLVVMIFHLAMVVLVSRKGGHVPYKSKSEEHVPVQEGFGRDHGTFIIAIISVLLLIRQLFYIATINKPSSLINEKLFYPLAAMTEYLAVVLFVPPGLVPSKRELPPNSDTGIIFIDLFNSFRQRSEA